MVIYNKIVQFKNESNEECFIDLRTYIKVIVIHNRQEIILARNQITNEDINELGEILSYTDGNISNSEIENSITRISKFVKEIYHKKVIIQEFKM